MRAIHDQARSVCPVCHSVHDTTECPPAALTRPETAKSESMGDVIAELSRIEHCTKDEAEIALKLTSALGYKAVEFYEGDIPRVWQKEKEVQFFSYLVGLTRSRDAIVPVIEKVINNNGDLEMKFNYALYDQIPPEKDKNAMTYVMAVKATARMLCIALLKAVKE